MTTPVKGTIFALLLLLVHLSFESAGSSPAVGQAADIATDPNLKVAFIGDSGRGVDYEAVLNLIQGEGAEMVLHQGDLAYGNEDVAAANAWYGVLNSVLGPDFPYFASMGNHDDLAWIEPGGYQDLLTTRLANTPGASCIGDYGINARCTYRGLEFVLSEGGNSGFTTDAENEQYIRDLDLAHSSYIWKICSWHHNQAAMQIGDKSNATGWGIYEACREAGAIIATGHEHSYSRTKTLTHIENQTVDTDPHPPDANGVPQNPNSVLVFPGKTFVFVSGLGGKTIRDQTRCLPYEYPFGCQHEWADIQSINQPDTNFGALFITFYVDGDPYKATAYFKSIDGNVLDSFTIRKSNTSVLPSPTPTPSSTPTPTMIETPVSTPDPPLATNTPEPTPPIEPANAVYLPVFVRDDTLAAFSQDD